MIVHVLIFGVIYAIVAALLAALISIGVNKQSGENTSSFRTRFIITGVALGILASLMYLQLFLAFRGFAITWDPARILGSFFTINPLSVLAAEYGWAQSGLALVCSLVVAAGFTVVFAAFSAIAGIPIRHGLQVGLTGGAVSVLSGLLYGFIYDSTGNSNMAIVAAILTLLAYSLAAFLFAPRVILKAVSIEEKVLRYATSHNGRIVLSECAQQLGITIDDAAKAVQNLEARGVLKKR